MTTDEPSTPAADEAFEVATSMQIVTAAFAENIQLTPVAGPATSIDITEIQFSKPGPESLPTQVTPHLVVLVWNPPQGKPLGALEVRFHRQQSGEEIARNVQPLQIEPGKFNYRLVRAELDFDEYGTVVAACRIDAGPAVQVPFTLLPPEPT